jgi:hypothetical protein
MSSTVPPATTPATRQVMHLAQLLQDLPLVSRD